MSEIWAALKVIGEILKFWKWFQKDVAEKKKVERDEAAIKQGEAIEDSKKATTEDEIFDSQKRIVDNKPS